MMRRGDSLESLLHAATNPDNTGPAMSAVENFAKSVNDTPEGARIAVRLLASKIQSMHEWEAMQALHVLEFCMQICNKTGFLSEVAKFRFLNEMIKLVSPKYLGNRTPPSVKTRVLEMLFTWTHLYPTETKILEAYDMLRKQGVVTEDHVPTSSCAIVPPRHPDKTSVFEDDDKSRLLRRLLQSKHPDDLQAANRLIKSMVKEDEKRNERQSKVMSTLEQVQNNSQLLAEMLAHYDKSVTSTADIELMAELYQACKQLRPGLNRMAEECEEQDTVLTDIVQAGEDLSRVLDNYERVIMKGEKLQLPSTGQTSLLDLTSPSEDNLPTPIANDFSDLKVSDKVISDADQLREVFASTSSPLLNESVASNFPVANQQSSSLPLPLLPLLSESQNNFNPGPQLRFDTVTASSDTTLDKLFSSRTTKKSPSNDPLDLDYLVQSQLTEGLCKKNDSKVDDVLLDVGLDSCDILKDDIQVQDDSLLDIEKPESVPDIAPLDFQPEKIEETPIKKVLPDCKALLADLHVTLESVKPSSKPPIVALNQPDGIVVNLHIAQNSPREKVYVVVVSIQNRLTQSISNITFQAVISDKSCKLRLQPPSTNELTAFNPFLPPPAATQLLLIANPCDVQIALKFMLSYCVDGDIVTEMGEVEQLPLS